ncbi:hypothetical protein Tco_1407754 [Tanacetum coccineum]
MLKNWSIRYFYRSTSILSDEEKVISAASSTTFKPHERKIITTHDLELGAVIFALKICEDYYLDVKEEECQKPFWPYWLQPEIPRWDMGKDNNGDFVTKLPKNLKLELIAIWVIVDLVFQISAFHFHIVRLIVWKLLQDYTIKILSLDMGVQSLSSRIMTVISHPDSGSNYKIAFESPVFVGPKLEILNYRTRNIKEPLKRSYIIGTLACRKEIDKEVRQCKGKAFGISNWRSVFMLKVSPPQRVSFDSENEESLSTDTYGPFNILDTNAYPRRYLALSPMTELQLTTTNSNL